MKDRLYCFTFFDVATYRYQTLEIAAKSFAEACPGAYVFRVSLNKKHQKSNWDIVSVKSKIS